MPTTSRSSPTTTSAVNEKRRPPLTTFATRLISTTRSWRSRPAGPVDRSTAMAAQGSESQREPSLASALGQRLDAAVVAVAAAVEDRALQARRLGALGQQRAGARGLLHAAQALERVLGPHDGGQGPAGVVVDELGGDPAVGAEHGQPRPGGGAAHLGAHPPAALEAALGLGLDG